MEQKREYNEHFKIILLGNNFVGKSSLLRTYCGGKLFISDEYMDTWGVDLEIKRINAFNKIIQLRIWDASGAPKLQKMISSYFRDVDGALICFDLTNIASFLDTKKHIEHLRSIKKDIPMILVGCKADLVHRREIYSTDAKEWAKELGFTYLEVSALREVNIDKPFTQITHQIYIATRLNKLKPKLEEYLNEYLKLTEPKNRVNFFTEQKPRTKEGMLREEYQTLFEKLFVSKGVEDLVEFCRKILNLIERADNLYKEDNPFLSFFVTCALSKALSHTLDTISSLLVELMDLTATTNLLHQKGTITNTL